MSSTPLSAGVYIEERDMSTNTIGTATSVGAYVGRSVWGPPNKRTFVTDEKSFAEMFGKPTDLNYEHFFTVVGFLKFGQALYFVRAVNDSAANSAFSCFVGSVSGGAGQLIEDWETETVSFGSEKFKFFSKYPGEKGNTDIRISLVSQTAYDALVASPTDPTYAEVSGCMQFIEYGPTKVSEYVVLVSVLNDSNEWELAERHLVSDIAGTKDNYGNSMYINQVINTSSKYIMAFNNIAITGEGRFFGDETEGTFGRYLVNGYGGTDADADIETGYRLFENTEEIEVNYLIGGANNSAEQAIYISEIAQTRKDVFSLHDVDFSDVTQPTLTESVAACNSFRTVDLTSLNTSYSALYAQWLYIYDKYNDTNRWVPCTGYVAGIYANTADVADSWFAPAGFNRGILKGVIKTAFNPTKSHRDQMYQKQVNPIVSFPGQGIVVWGQKTLQSKPSAFDRVNVRLLFLYMEKSISKSAQYMVFEQNDSLLRAVFLNMVDPFLINIKGRRGIYDYLIDVGDTVNTPEVIDANEFRAEIYVKPTRVAEAIVLRFTATKTSVNFAEL